MRDLINKLTKKNSRCFFYFGLWIVFFFICKNLPNQMDDNIFAKGIERYGSIWGWAKFFYSSWGGRIIPQGILVLLLQLPETVFHIIDSLMWIILLVYVDKIFNYRRRIDSKYFILIIAFCVFIFIPLDIVKEAVFWKCANVLYLWGTAMGLVAVYPFVRKLFGDPVRNVEVVFAILGGIYASSFEQVASVLSLSVLILFFIDWSIGKKADIKLAVVLLVICSFSAFFITVPGNAARVRSETLGLNQEFGMLSVVDKVVMGVGYALGNTEHDMAAVFAMMSVFAWLFATRFENENKLLNHLSFVNAMYFIANYVFRLQSTLNRGSFYFDKIYSIILPLDGDFGASSIEIVLELINVLMVIILGINIAFIIPGNRNYVPLMSYYIAFASMATMGFSPTIEASGGRPRFLGYVLLVCAFASTVANAIKYRLDNKVEG